jgi:hypothetical protein
MLLVWVHPPEPASCLHHYSVKNPTAVQPYKVQQLRATARSSHRQEAAPAAESLRSASLLIGGRRRTTCTLTCRGWQPSAEALCDGLSRRLNRRTRVALPKPSCAEAPV